MEGGDGKRTAGGDGRGPGGHGPIWAEPAALAGGVLLTNLLGAVFIGFIAGLAGRGRLNPSAALFWKTGVCGGFTTFSTFSLESLTLLERGKWLLGGSYMLLSMALCLLGAALGQRLSRL